MNPEAFQAGFACWLTSLRQLAEQRCDADQPVFNVDGKTHRRSHDRKNSLGALHSVSVWASDYALSLGMVATEEKSNEITAIPELLRLVDIKVSIITIDAMGTQKAIAKQIVDAQADYVLALKGNQGTLHDAVVSHIEDAIETDFAGTGARRHTTEETGHGREETRTYVQLPVPADLAGRSVCSGLKTIGVVISLINRGGQESSDARYYISSLGMGVKRFARAIRRHWSIENTCHWSLDMTWREDESRIRTNVLRENTGWLNRFSLSLLKQDPGKESIAMKRRHCAWNEDFFTQVLTAHAVDAV